MCDLDKIVHSYYKPIGSIASMTTDTNTKNMSADSKQDVVDQARTPTLETHPFTEESVAAISTASGYVVKEAENGHGDYKFDEAKVALRIQIGMTIGNVHAAGDVTVFGGGQVGNITCKGHAIVVAFDYMETGDIHGDSITRICVRRDPNKCCVMTAKTVQAPVVHVGAHVHSRVEKLVAGRLEIEQGGQLTEQGVVVEPT